MFPLRRMTALCLALISLMCLAVPAAAAERDGEVERLVHEFALTFQSGDIAAFAPLATESPVGNPRWLYVTSTLSSQRCIELIGEHATVVRAGDTTAFVLADIASTSRFILTPDKTGRLDMQWTLHLRKGANGWRIEGAAVASKELAIAFLAGEPEWSAVRAAEPFVNPGQLAYELANRASGGGTGPERATAGINHAETLAREVHDEAMLALCDFSRARLAWADKDFARATRLGEAAVARARTAGDPDTLGSALFGLAIGETKEHPDRAVADYTEVLDMIGQFANPRIGIASALNIADIRISQRDYRGATIMAQRVVELSEKYRWSIGASNALSDLGRIHDHLRDFAVARQYYARALAAVKDTGDPPAIMQALQGIGGDEFELGELPASLEHFREALKYSSRSPSAPVATAYHAYIAVLTRLRRYDEAEKLQKAILGTAQQLREGGIAAIAYADLSTIRLQQGQYEEAARLAREALSQNNDQDLAEGVYSSPWPLHLALGRALRAGGHRKEAIEELRAAVANIEAERDELAGASVSNFRFFADKTDAYHELIELLVHEKRPSEAFDVAERMRGHALVDAFAARPAASALNAEERSREESLERRVNEINKSILAARGSNNTARIAELRTGLDAARLDLDRFDEESGVVHAAVRTRETAASDASLPHGMAATAVVEYVVGDDSTIVFVLRPARGHPHITARVLPVGRKALAARVDAFCHAIESRDLGYARAAARLEATLLAPLMPALHGVSTIAIVPDAELWRLPFQALMTPDGRFLIQQFAVFYTPSLSMLREAFAGGSSLGPRPTLLAFGNPVVSDAEAARLRDVGYDGDIRPLPDAEREVRAIAALYGSRSRVYIKGEASENAFKHDAPQYDILHLATHGFLDDHSPMYSALLFAAPPDDPTEDGLLETREILHMRLHANMAVLAACDTGRGTAGPGEGVIGISWAFLMAGCPTTVVTQWKASSSAASILMVDFHRHLRNGAGKVEALRLAQVSMLHDRTLRHPFYWASFVMVGAP